MINEIEFCKGTKCPKKQSCKRYELGLGAPELITDWIEPQYRKDTGSCKFCVEYT